MLSFILNSHDDSVATVVFCKYSYTHVSMQIGIQGSQFSLLDALHVLYQFVGRCVNASDQNA